jgi:hypothetical protein
MKNATKLSLASFAFAATLGTILACGGSDDKAPSGASKLVYTDPPPASAGYRLEVSGGSGTETITLALRGPSTVMARGANFGLTLDQSKASFVKSGSDYASPGTVFDLGQTSPKIFKAVLDGDNMRVSMAQKGYSVPAKPLNGNIATVSIQLKSGAQAGAVALVPLDAKVLLDDGTVETVPLSVGTLEAQ